MSSPRLHNLAIPFYVRDHIANEMDAYDDDDQMRNLTENSESDQIREQYEDDREVTEVLRRLVTELDRQKIEAAKKDPDDFDVASLVAQIYMKPDEANKLLTFIKETLPYIFQLISDCDVDLETKAIAKYEHIATALEMLAHQIHGDPFMAKGYGNHL